MAGPRADVHGWPSELRNGVLKISATANSIGLIVGRVVKVGEGDTRKSKIEGAGKILTSTAPQEAGKSLREKRGRERSKSNRDVEPQGQ